MIDIKNLYNLSQYANFETFRLGEKIIIIYDDHRCVLTALFEAKKLGVIDDFTNLITFDLHDDAKPIHQETNILLDKWLEFGLSEISSRDFKNFIEYDISEYDDDWVNVGLELGLINNIINIGCEENSNIREWENNTYTSKSGKKHYGFVLGHLKDELNRHGGNIGDVAIKRNDTIRDILGYSHDSVYPSISNESNFVLDFDLDCFSTMCMGKRFAWPEDIFLKEYNPNSESGYIMNEFIRHSKFITICKEPFYCGGIGEANKILEYLDRYFFHGCLGTRQIK